MAQAKRKRRSKHRGTQAGTVEARGRTSRPRSRAEARQQAMQRGQKKRVERAVRPPSWRGATIRAGGAAAIFLAILLVLFHQKPVGAVLISVVMFGVYIPMGYYMDSFLFNLRVKREARQRAAAQRAVAERAAAQRAAAERDGG
jgi:hypothetical protein